MIETILGAAGWVLAAFLAGWQAACRRTPKGSKRQAVRQAPETAQTDAAAQAQAERIRREWQNFLNYDGRAQTLD